MQRITLTESERDYVVTALHSMADEARKSAGLNYAVETASIVQALKRSAIIYQDLADRIEQAESIVMEVK